MSEKPGFFDHFSDEIYYWRKELRYSLHRGVKVLSAPSVAATELVSYPLGVAVSTPTNLSAAIHSLNGIALPTNVNIGIAVGWNVMFDAPAAIINGVNLLLEEDDYRHTQNKIKGVVSILAGVTGLTMSYNPALEAALKLGTAGFAGPVFAFMALCDLANAAVDFYQASREVDVETWFEERIKEINFLENRLDKLIEELDKKFENSGTEDVAMQERIQRLITKKRRLEEDLLARAKVYCYQQIGNNKLEEGQKEKNQEIIASRLENVKKFIKSLLIINFRMH
jgi:hypothetical protein